MSVPTSTAGVRSWIGSTLIQSAGWGEDSWLPFCKETCWAPLTGCVSGPRLLGMLRAQRLLCESTLTGIPVSLRAEGHRSGRPCCCSSHLYEPKILLKQSMNFFLHMSSFSFRGIYLLRHFHSNCSYEITPNLEDF